MARGRGRNKKSPQRKLDGKKRAQSARPKKPAGIIPNSMANFTRKLAGFFTKRSFANFVCVFSGLVMCIGKHTISHIIQFAGAAGKEKHFTVFYKFFSRARWEVDELCRALVGIVIRMLLTSAKASGITVIVDDTLCRHTGSHIWGACMHYDPLKSNRTGSKKIKSFTFAHNWVILSIWVPVPWGLHQGIAIPVLFRLYRNKKTCPQEKYKKRTELAKEMISVVRGWIPAKYKVWVLCDFEYACSEVVQNLPANTALVGPARMDARLNEPLREKRGKVMGRPRTRGKRLPTPAEVAANKKKPWHYKKLALYGRRVNIRYKSFVALWPTVAGKKLVRIVVTQNADGKNEVRAYMCTDISLEPIKILESFCRRWAAEQMHQQVKEHMGVEDIRNGWWKNKRGRSPKATGSNHKENRGDAAVLRTAPIYFISYSLVAVWFLKKANYRKEVNTARKHRPWHKSKDAPSFGDMLFAARREIIDHRLLSNPVAQDQLNEIRLSLYTLLRAA